MIGLILDIYTRFGKSLFEIGVHEAALPIEKSKQIVELARKSGLIILGGDVYLEDNDGNIHNTYDSWHCNLNRPEDSAIVAHDYIEGIHGKGKYIVFVFKCSASD